MPLYINYTPNISISHIHNSPLSKDSSMAAFAKSLPLLFLLALLFSAQTLARESRFFSKVTRSEPTKSNEAQQIVNLEAKEEEEPAFLPQTSENGAPYGLYSRQADVDFSPSQTTTAAATTTTKKFSQQQYQPQKEEPTYYNNDKTNYLRNMETLETKEEAPTTTTTAAQPESKNYAAELQGVDGYTKGNGRADGYYNYYENKNSGGSYYGGEKQGMSDTRFMANSRYFYDAKNEKPATYYNAGAYQSKYLGRPEYYNNDGYYSGGTESFNNYYNKNTRRPGWQQQDKEEFEFDP